MFAPKPFDVAREMVRVGRRGGRIIMGNWIPNDPTLVAQILKISSAFTPPPPEGFVSPMTWGLEGSVTERFGAAGVAAKNVSFARDTFTFHCPGTPAAFVDRFKNYYGPTMNAFDAAEKNGRVAELQGQLEDLFAAQNQSASKDLTSIPATFLRVTHGTVLAGAIVVLLLHAAYVAAVMHWRRPVSVRRFVIELPTPRMTAIQYALGIIDAFCGVAVLYVLLPEGTDIGFVPFVAVYVLAVAVGALSSVPAGLGVVESMLLLMLRDVPPDQLLGSVLAYRLIYELVPFLWAVGLFVAYEAWSRRHWLRRMRVR
jgi:hypothetical protein